MRSASPTENPAHDAWEVAPYDSIPGANWTHVLLASPLARCQVLDPHHVRIYGKGRHNFSGMLSRSRLGVQDSGCSVPLYAAELGGALVLYGGKAGRELALELRRETNAVSVYAYDEQSRPIELMRSSYPPGNAVLAITRRGDTFACSVNDELVWRGSLPFALPPARVLLRALGDSTFAEGRERSAIFGPVRMRGALPEERLAGRVVGPAGEPVAGAWVHVAGDPFASALTGADGRFHLSVASTGSDRVIAGAEGYAFTSCLVDSGCGKNRDRQPGESTDVGASTGELHIELARPVIPRPEYPRPDFDRSNWWLNLNGIWRFALDPEDRGLAEGWHQDEAPYTAAIRVPFPWTSLLAAGEEELVADHRYTGLWSGYTGTAWYRRRVRLPDDAPAGATGVLKFLAVNSHAEIFWDGELVASHEGGFEPFECEIGELVPGTAHDLVVRVHYPSDIDPIDILVGKQGWWFTHAPGIWQTVWLEARSPVGHITRFHVKGDVAFRRGASGKTESEEVQVESASFQIAIAAQGGADAVALTIYDPQGQVISAGEYPLEPARGDVAGAAAPGSGSTARNRGDLARVAGAAPADGVVQATVPVRSPLLWDLDSPHLYRFEATLLAQGKEIDSVATYGGLRQIRVDAAPGCEPGSAPYSYVYLNDRPVYLVGILDQAYNPWGVYTYRALGPEDLPGSILSDLAIAKKLGYNLIRLHIKTNEPLWLYEAAKAGILVWDELPNFRGTAEGPGWARLERLHQVVHERDFNCPAIVIRSIINESWGAQDMRTNPATQAKIKALVARQRALEPHRLVVDNSAAQGYPNRHVDTDINDEHIYINDWWEWKRRLAAGEAQIYPGSAYNFHSGAHEPDEAGDARQSGQPFVISEFTSHGRKTLTIRMFPKIAGFVKIDLVDQEWERFTPYTYTRVPRTPQYLDADFHPLGEEMEHTLDAVVIDAPLDNYLARGSRTSVPVVVAAFHRALAGVSPVLHVRCVAQPLDDPTRTVVVYDEEVPLTVRPFTVQTAYEAPVICPEDAAQVYLFAWLARGDVVTARDFTRWRTQGAPVR